MAFQHFLNRELQTIYPVLQNPEKGVNLGLYVLAQT